MNLETKIYGKIKNEKRKVAFVLSGGGAKGAFQVGFLKAAIDYGFFPNIITGV
jgi:predicted acylesterase/phospholipase RssA